MTALLVSCTVRWSPSPAGAAKAKHAVSPIKNTVKYARKYCMSQALSLENDAFTSFCLVELSLGRRVRKIDPGPRSGRLMVYGANP